MIRAKYDVHNNGRWVECFLLKVEKEHYVIKCIIAIEAKDGNGMVLEYVDGDRVRIQRTRIPL